MGLGDCLSNAIKTVFWALVLVFISFPVAFLCAPFFIFCQVPEACCRCGCLQWFEKGLKFPGYCTDKMFAPFGCGGKLDTGVRMPDKV